MLGPILDASYGALAPVVMAGLCLAAWGFGAAIRFNIADIARPGARVAAIEHMDRLSAWVLAFAYAISVAYYLNLFGAFAVRLTDVDDTLHARMVTTCVFAAILLIGYGWGFHALERAEQIFVGLKLAVIAGLLAGMVVFFGGRAGAGALVLNPPAVGPVQGLLLAFGLIVTVQGFETVRYLGQVYDAATRIAAMRRAQLLSTAIYMAYVLLLVFVFKADRLQLSETAIIDLMRVVAPILPALLVAAALSAQFSAAVADTGGSGGLVAELTHGRVGVRGGYAAVVLIGVALTWAFDVFQIIAYASRAFAAYYALQAAIAAQAARQADRGALALVFWALAALGAAMAVLGIPAEGS